MHQDNSSGLEFQIGQLTGLVTSLNSQVASMSVTITSLDKRLRDNENNTTILMVKMSLLGMGSGAIGSLLLNLITKQF